jgi:hypothetical protein
MVLADAHKYEELLVALGFVSAIRCHDPCAMELSTHIVTKHDSIVAGPLKLTAVTSGDREMHICCTNFLLHKIHVGVWFAVTCKRRIESLFFIENLNI